MNLYNWNKLPSSEQRNVLSRPVVSSEQDQAIHEKTQDIINQVRLDGDKALIALAAQYDFVVLDQLKVTENEFSAAEKQVNRSEKQAMLFVKQQLETVHQAQLPVVKTIEVCEGVVCEQQFRPIERVGLYIPGGSAPLVSTVFMLAVPAEMASCPVRVLCTPANRQGEINPYLLVAARLCGIQTIYKVGGAQAIAAMAYGTESILKVDKIFGPGNAWVTRAKMLVAQDPNGASIDMPAGPSELMVIADENANATYVAADLLSQAEHGVDSQVMLLTFSTAYAEKVKAAILQQVALLPRKKIIEESLAHSRIIVVDNIEHAISISNQYAPEHLILHIADAENYIPMIQNAGAVFLGPWSPETVGDYVTGSNHVLPTYGYARSFSGLSLKDFMKIISFQTVTKQELKRIGQVAECLAELEGLNAHKQAVSLRLADLANETVADDAVLEDELIKVLFIDRDGTLIEEPEDRQVDNIEKLVFMPEVIPALLKLKQAGYVFVMVSNQDGLGTKRFPKQAFTLPHQLMLDTFTSQGITFAAIYICPHQLNDGCDCRKPNIGLVRDYLARQKIDPKFSYVVGDRQTDLEFAANLGIKGIRIGEKDTPSWTEIVDKILWLSRSAQITRQTRETHIEVEINLDTPDNIRVETGIGFFNHMLEQLAKHGGFSLLVKVCGDLAVDEHHTVEDTAIVLGKAMRKALGNKLGIARYGFVLPMDEALTQVAIDLSGRSYFVFNGAFTREFVGNLATELVPHFFRSFADGLKATLHIEVKGDNTHHMIEAMFKGVGRALRQAMLRTDTSLPTTKGEL